MSYHAAVTTDAVLVLSASGTATVQLKHEINTAAGTAEQLMWDAAEPPPCYPLTLVAG